MPVVSVGAGDCGGVFSDAWGADDAGMSKTTSQSAVRPITSRANPRLVTLPPTSRPLSKFAIGFGFILGEIECPR